MFIALIVLSSIAILIEIVEFNLEERRACEKCHDNRRQSCYGIVDKKCRKCPYLIKENIYEQS